MRKQETVAVLGASPKPERYSNKAVRMLREYGHSVIPVNPGQETIEGLPVSRDLQSIREPVDTVTVYLNPSEGERQMDKIAALGPKRVILNPGAESPKMADYLSANGIEVVEGCTLVMLRTGEF